MKILHVVGARPNFMKMAPVFNALKKYKVKQVIVHTGQHYSANMSDIFFTELGIRKPDVNLGVGSGSHGEVIASVTREIEPVLVEQKPDMVLVYGDINSTMGAALAAAKLGFTIGHVEAGLRSFDSTLPEEVNRIVIDRVSSLYFTPSKDANINLANEAIEKHKVHFVGNVMIDTLKTFLPVIRNKKISDIPLKEYGNILETLKSFMPLLPKQKNISPVGYGILTLHRPINVDNPKVLQNILKELGSQCFNVPLMFPVHPRTKEKLATLRGFKRPDNIIFVDPLGYIEFMTFVHSARFVITDSGGIQEETTYLGIPCLTMRPNTERPVTVHEGTNTLVGNDFKLLNKKIKEILQGKYKKGKIPAKWDGKAAERIAKVIMSK